MSAGRTGDLADFPEFTSGDHETAGDLHIRRGDPGYQIILNRISMYPVIQPQAQQAEELKK